jgi:hypothetical protein
LFSNKCRYSFHASFSFSSLSIVIVGAAKKSKINSIEISINQLPLGNFHRRSSSIRIFLLVTSEKCTRIGDDDEQELNSLIVS